MQPKVKIEGGAILSLKNLAKNFDKSVKNALEIIGYRLKREMEDDIKNDRMFWAKPTPLTLRMRKKYKSNEAAGVYFAKGAGDEKSFIRYRVDKDENTGYSLRVGVIDPPKDKAKPLSRSLKVNQQKFAQGFSFTATREFIRKRIKAYIKATRGTEWSKLSKRQKKNVKESLKEYGKHLLNIGVAIIVFSILQPIVNGKFETKQALYFVIAYIVVVLIGNVLVALGGNENE